MSNFVWKFATCNVHGINILAKQEDIICWHKDSGNLVSIITETKLRSSCRVKVFSSELDKKFFGADIVIIINTSLAYHVCKVSEVSGWLLLVKLLFKNKLSMSILGLYTRASLAMVSEDVLVSRTNSWGVGKTINFLFVFTNLVNAVVDHIVSDIGKFFDIDHRTIFVSMGLGGLLDMQLNSLHKQANKNHWKFDFKDADDNSVFIKVSSKFHKLELLVSKIVKASCEDNVGSFVSFIKCWDSLDSIKASVVQDLINSNATSSCVHFALSGMKKFYYVFKLAKSLATKEVNIRTAINKRIESFKMNKGHTIRSVLEHLFSKVVLNHLVVKNELILEPDSVKSKTKKHGVVVNVSNVWSRQYRLLNYVFDEAFSGVMHLVKLNKLLDVISNLSNGKTANFSGITNELWKHCDKSILVMLLALLNLCLSCESVLGSWTEAWVSMILKPYEISLACSTFNVLCEDNFLVLKDMMTQSPIFAVGSVVEDALKKSWELWLVLQNMRKAYNSKSLIRIKMCSRFIQFFGGIYKNCTNKAGISSFLAAGTFVDNTIWVGSSQAATQYILNIASEFFWINDISIINNKTVAIPINSRINASSLFISGLLISIAKKDKFHQYLGIFFSTEGFSKPSLAKTNSNIHFFTNLVLKKAVSDKQFLYLVLAVFYPIVSYRTQFSFVSISMCNKWDALIHKGLKFKFSLPLNFLSDTIHHPSFYGLKSFFQVQSESKMAFLVSFANSDGILGHLFFHRSYDLQVLSWHPVYSLSSPVHIRVSASNNFLAGMIHILFDCNLSLDDSLANPFRCHDLHGLVPKWFKLSVAFFNSGGLSPIHPSVLNGVGSLNILESSDFVYVCNCLSQVGANSLLVYTVLQDR
ncbi:hypothetical protein G9A89_016724 [Geosiphon pyriformis]|nr:hypothetical protein G9A89_016724 [Geosiphon pyriformis]